MLPTRARMRRVHRNWKPRAARLTIFIELAIATRSGDAGGLVGEVGERLWDG